MCVCMKTLKRARARKKGKSLQRQVCGFFLEAGRAQLTLRAQAPGCVVSGRCSTPPPRAGPKDKKRPLFFDAPLSFALWRGGCGGAPPPALSTDARKSVCVCKGVGERGWSRIGREREEGGCGSLGTLCIKSSNGQGRRWEALQALSLSLPSLHTVKCAARAAERARRLAC